jgi:hypothetical protein
MYFAMFYIVRCDILGMLWVEYIFFLDLDGLISIYSQLIFLDLNGLV